MAIYKYQKLERSLHEIRLLRLIAIDEDVERDDPIPCEIKIFSLDDRPQYVALSYTWGHPGSTGRLGTNDGDLNIAHNLQEALQQLQLERFSSWLWVDAVCINQNDDVEKSWQVQQMRSVYETAESVLIWLGPAADNSDAAFERLRAYGAAVAEHMCIKNWQIRFWYNKFRNETAPTVTLKPTDLTLEQILSRVKIYDAPDATIPFTPTIALLSRPWWTRIWVLQELWVADKAVFLCGRKRLLASHMAAAMTVFKLYLQAVEGSLYTMSDGEVEPRIDSRPYLMLSSRLGDALGMAGLKLKSEMLTLLHATSPYMRETRRLNASDDRDRVFALLGLSWDADKLGICADYTKTTVDVYTEVTMALVRRHGFATLSKCFFPKTLPGLPSWVIDWSAPSQGYKLVSSADGEGFEFGPDKTIIGTDPAFCASEGIETSRELYIGSGGPRSLCLLASQVDVIEDSIDEHVLTTFRFEVDATINHYSTLQNQIPNFINSDYRPGNPRYSASFAMTLTPSGQLVLPHGNSTPEEVSRAMRTNPYAENKVFDSEVMKRSVEVARKFISAVRPMAKSNDNMYGGPIGLEDAIWRTPIADQEATQRDYWVRPAKCFLPMVLLMLDDWNRMPTGLQDMIGFALTQRLHEILLKSGLFAEFVIEAARDIIYNRFPLRPIKLAAGKKLGAALRRYGILESVGITTEDDLDRLWHDNMLPQEEILASIYAIIEKSREPNLEKEGVHMVSEGFLYLRLIRSMMLGRTMFVTKSGYLGLGPMHLRSTDIVIVAHEAAVPFVLRPKRDGKYEFVGECYVHGIMDGEFMANQVRRGEATFKIYEIE